MTNLQGTYRTALRKGMPGQIANSELSNRISRTVESAAGIAFGQPAFRGSGDHGVVVGAAFAATAVGSAAASGNVGTGVITAAPAVAAGAKQGRYKAVLIATGATAPFLVYDPDGLVVGDGVVASAATIDGIGPFTISNAGTMTAGDTYYIDVTYTANAAFVGLAILDEGVITNTTTPDAIQQYQTGSFETTGPMYVTAGGAVNDGDQVYWNPATGRYTANTAHIRLANCRFDTTGVDGDIVEVMVRLRNA